MQASALAWQGGLRATGGALKPEKCSWTLVAFQWKQGQWSYHTKETFPALLQVPGPDGNLVEIERHDPSTAIKVVGLMQSLDGSMEGQFQELKTRADGWAERLREGKLPRKLAWTGLTTSMWPSLRYPLPTTNFSEAQGDKILTEFYKALLPKLGVCRNFPKAYRHAPHTLQGLALPAPYIEQSIGQIQLILTHGSLASMTGKFFTSSLEQAQLEAGTGMPLLEAPFLLYGDYTTPNCWVRSLWEFLSKHNIKLRGAATVPQLQRLNNRFLMEIVIALPGVNRNEIKSFNRCRLYCQALTLADICTSDGTRIRASAWNCIRDHNRTSRLIWLIEKPCKADVMV